jgi:uncharacterized protein YecE (DUF72 family)
MSPKEVVTEIAQYAQTNAAGSRIHGWRRLARAPYSRMRILAGTSGFSYKEWKGSFYPEDMKPDGMLSYYADRFDTVELNNTFYRLPTEKALAQWAEQVPDSFRFALKASRTITHLKRLRDVADPVEYLCRVTRTLGDRRGPILFGLPPNMKADTDRLRGLLDLVPADVRAAIEFRHDSWHDDIVFDLLRDFNAALCVAHTDEDETPFVATADWGYLRLRATAYSPADLRAWRDRIASQSWDDAFVYFKHEEAGTGPRLAAEFLVME